MAEEVRIYAGPWVKVWKPPESATRPGPAITLIHDDEVAKSLGFAGGLVGGPTLAAVTTPAIFASFGHSWYENGAYSVRYVRPVYDQEEVRVVWQELKPDLGDKRKITFWLERRDGERTTFGWAALGGAAHKLTAPWERSIDAAAPPAESADDLLPNMHVGDTLSPFDCLMTREDILARHDRLEDRNWWYSVASPWGAPILPPDDLGVMVLQRPRQPQAEGETQRTTGRTPMYAGFDLVVYGPLFTDRTYRFHPRLVEKGRSERSVFFSYEYGIDDESGQRVAVARAKTRHFISTLIP
jgi:hypothetical protein